MRPVKILIRMRHCAVWSESSLGAHIRFLTLWFIIFQMICRDIMCIDGRRLSGQRCEPEHQSTEPTCFVAFIKLTPSKNQFLWDMHLTDPLFLNEIQAVIARDLPHDSIKKWHFYKNSTYSDHLKVLTVDYLVIRLEMDYSAFAMLDYYLQTHENSFVTVETLSVLIQMFVEFAVYNFTIEPEINIFVPHRQGTVVDILSPFYQYPEDAMENLCNGMQMVEINKLHIHPFVRVGLSEFESEIENSFLIMHVRNEEFVFSNWQYEHHDEDLLICLDDFLTMYNALLSRPKANYSLRNTGAQTKYAFFQSLCSFVQFYIMKLL